MQALDSDISLANECLAAYLEFKRQSVQLIFDRFADDMDNEIIGGNGFDHDENLETLSSLDNEGARRQLTAEDEIRFSQSIASST